MECLEVLGAVWPRAALADAGVHQADKPTRVAGRAGCQGLPLGRRGQRGFRNPNNPRSRLRVLPGQRAPGCGEIVGIKWDG